ncbi:hypothetical protein FRB90_008511 [Tulasnella sp. 427]|nr:hypothetical protein FRB90_008511 [Tulasnella sp. 427]
MDTDELQSSSDSEDSIDGTELSIDDLPYLSPQEASPTERRPAGCIKLRRNKDGRRYYTRDRAAHLKAHDHPAPRKAWAAWEKQVAETGLSRYLEAIGTDLPSFQRLGYNEQRPALEDVWELIKVSLARNRRTVDGFKMWGAKRWGLKTTRNRK